MEREGLRCSIHNRVFFGLGDVRRRLDPLQANDLDVILRINADAHVSRWTEHAARVRVLGCVAIGISHFAVLLLLKFILKVPFPPLLPLVGWNVFDIDFIVAVAARGAIFFAGAGGEDHGLRVDLLLGITAHIQDRFAVRLVSKAFLDASDRIERRQEVVAEKGVFHGRLRLHGGQLLLLLTLAAA